MTTIRCNCIVYRAGEKEAVKRWASEMLLGPEDADLPKFQFRISKALGLDKRCADVGISKYTTELATRSFEAVPGFENGRVYDVDAQEGWNVAYPALLKGDRDLIGKPDFTLCPCI